MSNLFKDLKNSSNLITGHINPDGDALGSALAFKLILDSKGVESDVSFDMKGNVPSNLNHLPIDLILDSPKKNYENVYVFDCGNSERLGDLEEIALNSARVIVVDHHINPSFGDIQVIDSNAASTTQVLFREILSAKIDIDKNIANCLMTGLITDTGRFQYSNTDNEVFEIASKLMLSGAELTSISDNIYGSIPLNAIKLQSEVLNRIELYEDEEKVGTVPWGDIVRVRVSSYAGDPLISLNLPDGSDHEEIEIPTSIANSDKLFKYLGKLKGWDPDAFKEALANTDKDGEIVVWG